MLTHVDIIREFVILNGCEGSQNHAEQRYLTLAPAGTDRWFALLSMTGTVGSTAILLP